VVVEEFEGAEFAESIYISRCELDDSAAVPRLHLDYESAYATACGRRPMTNAGSAVAHTDADGVDYFVRAAQLEADAVQAFHEMAGHLLGFGAPASLVQRCRQAAQEELGHALRMSEVARQISGDNTLLPHLRSKEQIWRNARMAVAVHAPSFEDFARHNGVEGCVRESLGAAVALWQSLHSSAQQVRILLASIAEEEVSHAQLSWDIDAWCRSKLSGSQQEELAAAKTRAAEALWHSLSANDNEAGGVAGLPDTAAGRRLLDRIASSSWALVVSQS
jgi:hypothetical protein